MFHGIDILRKGLYIGALEMGDKTRNDWCFYTIYGVVILKDIVYFIKFFSQMLKKKYIQKYFGFSKMDKKMSKNEKGRNSLGKTTFVTEM